jgi:curli biogenesis system outer membrane secretion channel CsgG
MNRLVIVFSILVLTSCADSYTVKRSTKYEEAKLNDESSAYVSLPEDGVYGTINYNGSGATSAQIVKYALLKHMVNVVSADLVEDYDTALNTANDKSFDYLVFLTILHWEDRATEWSAKPDKVSLKVVFVDVKTKNILSSVTIDGKSGLATFGGDRPQDLLAEPLQKYIDRLFN